MRWNCSSKIWRDNSILLESWGNVSYVKWLNWIGHFALLYPLHKDYISHNIITLGGRIVTKQRLYTTLLRILRPIVQFQTSTHAQSSVLCLDDKRREGYMRRMCRKDKKNEYRIAHFCLGKKKHVKSGSENISWRIFECNKHRKHLRRRENVA